MKKAVIIGANGQDGRLLQDDLVKKNYHVVGIDRGLTNSTDNAWNSTVDIESYQEVADLIRAYAPDEIYHLAAFHHSSEDPPMDAVELFENSSRVHVSSLVNVLEGVRRHSPATRLFYACSSHIYRGTTAAVQDEGTPISPICMYGITKASGLLLCRMYRSNYQVFASTGILYNHESPLRSEKFVTRKIIKAAVDIKNGSRNRLVLGDLNAENDWGYAQDYIDAFQRIVRCDKPDDFIVATGIKHSVRDFVETAFGLLGLDWTKHVEENKKIITRKNVTLVGDSRKLRSATGWKPTVGFKEMIKLLLSAEGADLNA